MGFWDTYFRDRTVEWEEFYFDYEYLRTLTSHLKPFRNRAVVQAGNFFISNFTEEERKFIEAILNEYEDFFIKELQKISRVHRFLTNRVLRLKLLQIAMNVSNLRVLPNTSKQAKEYNKRLRRAVKNYYLELMWIRKYGKVNIEACYKGIKRYRRWFGRMGMFQPEKEAMLDFAVRQSHPIRILPRIPRVFSVVDSLYARLTGTSSQTTVILKLQRLYHEEIITASEWLILGLLLGILTMGAIVLIFLLVELDFFTMNNTIFVRYSFPLFRGLFIICCFQFFWAVAVYMWIRFGVDYSRIFKINIERTRPFVLFYRSMLGMIIINLLFLYCAVSSLQNRDNKLSNIFSQDVSLYLPCAAWLIFIIYMLIPFKLLGWTSKHNWLFPIFLEYVASPCRDFGNEVNWFGTQTVSFNVFCRDFVYFWCYFVHLLRNGSVENTCLTYSAFIAIQYVYSLTPLVWRFLSALTKLRVIKDNRAKKVIYMKLLSVTISIATSILGNFTSFLPVLIVWICLVAFGSLFGSFIETKFDWQLLKSDSSNFYLRDVLIFQKKWLYYVGIFLNMILKFIWVMTLQPISLFTSALESQISGAISGSLEMFRRSLWNLFVIETYHISKMRKYKILEDLDLPYKFPIKMSQHTLGRTLSKLVENVLEDFGADANAMWGDIIMPSEYKKYDPLLFIDNNIKQDGDYLATIRSDYVEYLKESIENIALIKDELLNNNIVFLNSKKKGQKILWTAPSQKDIDDKHSFTRPGRPTFDEDDDDDTHASDESLEFLM